MDVDVHVFRRQRKHDQPVAARRPVEPLDRRTDHRVADAAAVHERDQLEAALRPQILPPQPHGGRRGFESGSADLGFVAPHPRQQFLDAAAARTLEDALAVVDQRERDGGIGERVVLDQTRNAAELRRGRLEELAPRRQIIEKILDDHRRAGTQRHRRDAGHAVFIVQRSAFGQFGATAVDFEVTDGADAAQRFAAIPQRGNRLEVRLAADLAGGVFFHRQGQFFRDDAAAVVLHGDQHLAALPQFHVDGRRAGVEAVFDQFLDDGKRPLDHLAGGDLARKPVGQSMNSHHSHLSFLARETSR